MYHNNFMNSPLSLSLCGFLGMLLFGSVGLWGIVSWLLSDSAPLPDETVAHTIPIDSSTLYQWQACSGKSFNNCHDKYRLCITSLALPAPDNPYCYISIEPISPHLDNLPPGTTATLHLASDPAMDKGRRMHRFWELSINGVVELSMARITNEHNSAQSWELQKNVFSLVFAVLCYYLYRYGRQKSRTS